VQGRALPIQPLHDGKNQPIKTALPQIEPDFWGYPQSRLVAVWSAATQNKVLAPDSFS
jgi:hypothetical protein